MSCGLENPNGELLCLAHANTLSSGKGMGLKSKDEAGAICCDTCHSLIDGRTQADLSRLQRFEMHEQANRRTTAWWRKNGYLPA